jgi:hypothetical protein
MKKLQHIEKRNPELGLPNLADRIRHCCLYVLIFGLTCHAVFGEIKNGYEKNISGSKQSLTLLRAKLVDGENITPAHRRKIQSTIKMLVNHIAYYDLTEGLLTQFKTIAPELYAQIDTITDRLGRPVDVYIKFVPVDATSVKALGLTYMDQVSDDKDAYQSEYGQFTVSVKVWIDRRALLVLAHELGHVKYQVPNLASYFDFYKANYDNALTKTSLGHSIDDPSGKWATQFGKTFQKKYADFLKISIEKIQNPLNVLVKLKKSWAKHAVLLSGPTKPNDKMGRRFVVAAPFTRDMTYAGTKPSSTRKSLFPPISNSDTVVRY